MMRGAAETPEDPLREARVLKPFACVSCYGLAAAARSTRRTRRA